MLHLFQIGDGEQNWPVPVADGTAATLERALLATDAQQCIDLLTTALVADPALALWVVQESIRAYDVAPTTIDALAGWLSESLPKKLAAGIVPVESSGQSPAGFGQARQVPPNDAARLATLHAEILAAAIAQFPTEDEQSTSPGFLTAIFNHADRMQTAWAAPSQPTTQPLDENESHAAFFLSGVADVDWRLPALVATLVARDRLLDDFADRLEQEKLSAMKELAYGAGHEINNPLANIAARAQTLIQDETDPERSRKLAAIHRQAMRAHEMIADLMLFARPPKLELVPCDPRPLVATVVAKLADEAAARDMSLTTDLCEEAVSLVADETQLSVAVWAVVTNSIEAVGHGGRIEVAVRLNTVDQQSWAEIVVTDDGPGISAEVRQHLFDPFYSGREAGRGLGFGLSKCWRIVTDHGGQVVVSQSKARGAQISILLPAVQEAVHPVDP